MNTDSRRGLAYVTTRSIDYTFMDIGDGDLVKVEYVASANGVEAGTSTNGGECSYLVLRTVSKERRNGNARHPVSAWIVNFGQVCVL
jgi:hypothetical protein